MQYSEIESSNNEQVMLKSVGPYREQVSGSSICEAPAIPHVTWGSSVVGTSEVYTIPKECMRNPEIIEGALSSEEVIALEESMGRYSRAFDILSQH